MANMIDRIKNSVALPSDARNPAPRIIIAGREVMIGGKVTLSEYTPELLSVQRSDCIVSLHGRELLILSMDDTGICVGGIIESIVFEK